MKTAIIGTGFIAEYHKKALLNLGYKLDLVVGSSSDKAAAFAADTGAMAAGELSDAMLREMDCFIVCTPPSGHAGLLERLIKAEKNIFCEKPLCLSAEEADHLEHLAEESRGLTAIDFNNRFFPSVTELKNSVKEIRAVRGTYLQQYHILPAPYSWRYEDRMRAVTEIGSHMIDLITYTTGMRMTAVKASFINATPKRVLREGIMYRQGEGTPVEVKNEDEAFIRFTLENGAEGHVELSEIAAGHENDITLRLVTPEGTAIWSNQTAGVFEDTFRDALKAFYASSESGVHDPRLCSLQEAAYNVRVCSAIYNSACSGKEVKI